MAKRKRKRRYRWFNANLDGSLQKSSATNGKCKCCGVRGAVHRYWRTTQEQPYAGFFCGFKCFSHYHVETDLWLPRITNPYIPW